MFFEEVESGLYLFRSGHEDNQREQASGYSFLTLAEGSTKEFTESKIDRNNVAQKLHRRLGYPS